MRTLFTQKIGLRRATSVVFALVTVLPLLTVLPVMDRAGLLEQTETQISLLLAVSLALLGFIVLRRLVDRVAQLAAGVSMPRGGTVHAESDDVVPGLGHVAEIGQIGDAFARMLEDLRMSTDRLEDLVFKLSSLSEVVELASRIPQMQDLLSLVLERTMRTVRATIGSIMLLDRERQVLRVVVARGLPQDVVGAAEVPVGDGIAGKVVQLGEPVLVDDIAADPRFARENDPRYGSGAFICLPVRVEDRIIGVVNLAKSAVPAPRTPGFSPTDLQFLNTLMAHVAYAVDNARLLQEAQLSATRLRTVIQDLRTAQARVVEGETLRAVGQMASGMAHHVNNLLAVVAGRVQLLLMRVNEPEVRRPLEIVQRATFDAAEVVRRVLGFTAVHPVATPIPVDLNEVVREVVELTRPRWRDEAQMRAITIAMSLALGDIPRVAGEAAALREVVMNLLLNAIDALAEGGTMTVSTWTADGWVYCAVADTGVGMPEDVRARALEPFFTTKGPRGTGLGLSVAHGIVQRHGGELDLRTADGGKGTVAIVRLPPTPAADARPAPATPPPLPRRILIIDDEAPVREALADAFAEDGHTVLQASSGREGLAALERGSEVDLVLTDLGMPEMTGWEVARAIRARWPGVPVGLVTGWAVTLEMSAEERSEIDFVVAKPYTLDALRAALASLPLRPR